RGERPARPALGVGGDRARAAREGRPLRARRLPGRGPLDREALEPDRLVRADGGFPGGAVGVCGRGVGRRRVRTGDYYWAVMVPKRPSDSSAGPAVKKSVVAGPLLAAPLPNCKAQRPSIATGYPLGLVRVPSSVNEPSGCCL